MIVELKTRLLGFSHLGDDERANPARKPEVPKLPSPEEIVTHLNRHVIGHDAAKRTLATACYDHLMQCAATDLMGGKVGADNNTIVAGPSGSGKSAMIEVLGDFLGVPVVQVDCTNITPSGYKGKNLSQILDDLEERLVVADRTIPTLVVWEEIDKLAACGGEAGRYREMAQSDALRFLDGARCGASGRLDGSRILNIGCGAFVGLERIRNPEQSARIGFHLPGETEVNPERRDAAAVLQPEHLVKFGLMTEFVGRFSRFTVLDVIDRDVMRRIITDSESSVLVRKIAQFALHGVRLVFDDAAIDAVAEMAMVHPTGARGLRMILGRSLGNWEFQLPDLSNRGVTEIVFDAKAVRGEGEADVRCCPSQNVRTSLLEARRKAGSYAAIPPNRRSDELSEL